MATALASPLPPPQASQPCSCVSWTPGLNEVEPVVAEWWLSCGAGLGAQNLVPLPQGLSHPVLALPLLREWVPVVWVRAQTDIYLGQPSGRGSEGGLLLMRYKNN